MLLYSHEKCTLTGLLNCKPPRSVVADYRKGKGKGDKAWVEHFQKWSDAWYPEGQGKGKEKGKGKGKGKGENGGKKGGKGSGKGNKDGGNPNAKAKAKAEAKKPPVAASAINEASVEENIAFAATGRLTCNKLVCNDTNCHNVKNHSGYPPLPRNPDIQAAAVVGIASN